MERNKELKVQAVVFDLDGLLIDSEPQWQAAEVEVFGALGVPLTPEMCRQTVGLRIEEAVGYWRVRYPWGEPEDNIVADRVVARMLELITSAGEPMPGAVDAVRVIHDHGIPAAVATSSRHQLAAAALERLGLSTLVKVVCSAQDHAWGKPHPAVYLDAVRRLGIAPEHCLAFEDSINGMISAKAARMRCAVVPFPVWRDDPRFVLADYRLESLEEIDAAWIQRVFDGGIAATDFAGPVVRA